MDRGPCREAPLSLGGEGGEGMRAGRGLLFSICLSPSPPSHSLGTLSPLRGARGPDRSTESYAIPLPFQGEGDHRRCRNRCDCYDRSPGSSLILSPSSSSFSVTGTA